MNNTIFVIIFLKVFRNACLPPTLEHDEYINPRTPCHILCPPVFETHRGGSTDLEKGDQSKYAQKPGGKEISKGDGED